MSIIYMDSTLESIKQRDEQFNAMLLLRMEQKESAKQQQLLVQEKIHNRNNFLFALGGCILLSIALGVWIFYSRSIVRKNKGLYRQIKEQDRLAEELEAMKNQYGRDVARNVSTTGNQQQLQLVSRLYEYLLLNKNFVNPDIERDQLVSELATNKTYLFDAVKAVTGKSLQEYINNFRLEEARRLFDNHSDLNIEVLAEKCGFNSYRAFYRAFRDCYKMNPAEYRKMATMNSK